MDSMGVLLEQVNFVPVKDANCLCLRQFQDQAVNGCKLQIAQY